jgi:peroxiredoxin
MRSRKRTRTPAAMTVVLLALLACTAHAQIPKDRTPPAADSPPGTATVPQASNDPSVRIEVGVTAPDFELEGTSTRPVRLSSLRGGWVALMFSERIGPISSLEKITGDMTRMGVRMVVVCHEKARRVRTTAQRDGLSFLILADASGQVGSLYGLTEGRVSSMKPGYVLIDARGVVKLNEIGEPLVADRIWQRTRNYLSGL